MTPQTAFVDGELIPCQELTLENPIHRRLVRAAILASDATTDEEKEPPWATPPRWPSL